MLASLMDDMIVSSHEFVCDVTTVMVVGSRGSLSAIPASYAFCTVPRAPGVSDPVVSSCVSHLARWHPWRHDERHSHWIAVLLDGLLEVAVSEL